MPFISTSQRSELRKESKIFVTGHRGLLGRALVKRLTETGFRNLLVATHGELDLRRQSEVKSFFRQHRPEYVFLSAARVGGIAANQRLPVDFLSDNLQMETSILRSAFETGVAGLCLFGSSCMYPREGPQPMREEDIGTGSLEPTSRAYATAKLAGLELCRAYRSQHQCRFFTLIPATLYGPHDHFRSHREHVIPALIERFHDARVSGAKAVTVLGTGKAKREFLYVTDAATAAIAMMQSDSQLDVINAGSGEEVSIQELARLISQVVAFTGRLEFDSAAPDGAPRKLLDSSKIQELGWSSRVALDKGLERSYSWFLESNPSA